MLPMLPYNIDPSWFEKSSYSTQAEAKRARRTEALVRLALSSVIIVATVVVLHVLQLHGA